eukprot:TRINITY_DN3854_c0_g1_i3.p1 TRINITY_DN3854_c0_g1~~TRINITY_DN3854_c0_g1_i3.p1  ORF type:complete len:589 (+),score=83.32 TRINITY_DN3854_c0_g1_i3:173-1939(+)
MGSKVTSTVRVISGITLSDSRLGAQYGSSTHARATRVKVVAAAGLVLASCRARRSRRRNLDVLLRCSRIRLGAGGEQFGVGSGKERTQLLLGEGLGPFVSSSFDERRDSVMRVRLYMSELLAGAGKHEGSQTDAKDRVRFNHLKQWHDFLTSLDALENWPKSNPEESDDDMVQISLLRGRSSCLKPSLWKEMLRPDESAFLEYDFLSGLEESGSVTLLKGWQPRFLLACRDGPFGVQLVGAVPMYLKMHSEGEFCEEADWIEAACRRNIVPWPHLFVGVPYTPHVGRRVLTAAWLKPSDRVEVQQLLVRGLRAISVQANLSVNVAFGTQHDNDLLGAAGFVMRTARQAWWSNRKAEPYLDFADFLRTLRVKNAREISRQRAAVRDAEGVSIEVLDGSADPSCITPALMTEMFHSCYAPTMLRNGNVSLDEDGMRFDLSEEFFHMLGERLPHRVLLVRAVFQGSSASGGKLLGGSLCFIKDGRISGRYWGFPEEISDVPFLHFECCYYALIEHAIKNGYSAVEPGNGGGDIYRVQRRRGFEPSNTPSYHFSPNSGLREDLALLAAKAAAKPPSWTKQRNSAYAPVPRKP